MSPTLPSGSPPPPPCCLPPAVGAAVIRGRRPRSPAPCRGRPRLRPEHEVGGADRRREAVVERLRDPQQRMDPVPAQPDRALVDRELAGMEEPVDLDRAERRLEHGPVLGDRVLAEMPGVVRLLGALGREGEPVRRRDERQRGGRRDRAEQRRNILDVLDRLQEDDRVERSGDVLDEIALESQVRAHVAGLRMIVGLRVGVDPDDLGGPVGEDIGSVALPAGEVGHAHPVDPRRDPLVDGEVAAEPVVLLGHVGERPLTGQLERRDALRLAGLDVAPRRFGDGRAHRAADATVPRHASGC